MNQKNILSQDDFMKGIQCLKYLYLDKNRPDLKPKPSIEETFRFRRKKDVVEFARNLYPDGLDLSFDSENPKAHFMKSILALESRAQVYYEPAFQSADGLLNFKSHLLVISEKRTMLIEVKGSTEIKLPNH